MPLDDGSRLLISYDVDARVRASQNFVFAMIAGVVATALFGALASWLLARDAARRLDAVSRAMTRILAGDLSQRLPVSGRHAGVDRLATEFNVALERIERLTGTMRAVADSTAHDLRAPLNRLRAAVEVALRREDDPAELRAALDTVLVEVDRVQNTLEALLRIALAESGTAPIESVDLTAVVADVEGAVPPLAEEKGLGFATHIDPALELPGNRQLLAQAVANLVDNAIKSRRRAGGSASRPPARRTRSCSRWRIPAPAARSRIASARSNARGDSRTRRNAGERPRPVARERGGAAARGPVRIVGQLAGPRRAAAFRARSGHGGGTRADAAAPRLTRARRRGRVRHPVHYFEIPVTDLDRAVRFYETVFGCDLERAVVDGYEMALFPYAEGGAGATGALAKGDAYVPSRHGAIVYFRVDDIDRVVARALSLGAELVYPKKSLGAQGCVAEIVDSEGNRIALHAGAD